MTKTLRTYFQGKVTTPVFWDGKTLSWTGKADIDNDGPNGNPQKDPDHQETTSLKQDGKSIDSNTVCGVVIPESLIADVEGVLMGCQCFLTYGANRIASVAYDIGPKTEIGEISVAAAKRLGIPDSPTKGGVPNGVSYEVTPGIPAVVDGVTYTLQPS